MDREIQNTSREPETKQPEPTRPTEVIRDGNLKASIWRNESDDGAFYATTFARTYRDQEGAYRDSNSFVAADLLRLSELARNAYARTNELRRDDRAQAQGRKDGTDRETFRARRSGESRHPPKDYER